MSPTPRLVSRSLLRVSAAALSAGLVFPLVSVHAADGTFTNTSGGTWSTTGNWSGSVVADGADFTANFSTLNITVNRTINLNSARTIGNMIFADATTAGNDWTLANNGSGTNILTLDTTSGTPTITVVNRVTTISLELAGTDGMTKEGSGTLTLTGVNTYTGATTVNAGTLNLGSGGTGSLNSASTLAMGGNGIFNFTGAAAASQTLGGLSVNAGQGTVNNTVAGTTLSLGNITRASDKGMVLLGNTGNINTTSTNTNGIIGTWALRGSGTTLDYAVSNGAGVDITSLGAATTLPSAGPGSATTNYTLAGAQTQTADTVGNTLRYTGAAGALALGTTSLDVRGLMNAGTGLLTISGTPGSAGLVTTGGLDITSNTQGITVSSVISGSGPVVYGGPSAGTLTLSGANTYTGGTFVNGGIVRATTGSALGDTSGAVSVAGGARLQLANNITVGNAINLSAGATLDNPTSANTVTGDITLSGNATIAAQNTSGNTLTVGNVNIGANTLSASASSGTQGLLTIAGTITGSGAINKSGNGSLTINNDQTSTYSGTTTLTTGSLYLGNGGALGSGTIAFNVNNDATATIASSNASAVTIANAMTIGGGNGNSVRVFGGNGSVVTNGGGTGAVTFTNTTSISLGSTLRRFSVQSATRFDAGFTGTGGIDKRSGTATLTLNGTNTYTGATTISAGTLQLGNGGTTGSLAAASAITVGAGTTFAVNRSDAIAQGTDFATIISGAGSFVQAGGGTTTMAAGNTYTGTTTISAGTLALGASDAFADASNFVMSGGTLAAGAFSDSVGTLSLTANSFITLGSGGTFAFADSSLLDWGSSTLSITGTFVDGVSIRFGLDADGLTGDQLALISINGAEAGINEFGYLTAAAIPEPASAAMLAGGALLGLALLRRRRS